MADDGTPLPNVASVTFREQEAAFLAGMVAAMTSDTGHIGFIGGMETPPVVRVLTGHTAGIATVDPEIELDHAFVGSFRDPAKAKVLAEGMFDAGVAAVLYENKALVEGTFVGGPQSLGLAEGAVGLCAANIDSLPADVLVRVEAAKAAIIAGELVIPGTYDALELFEPGAL